LFERQKKRRGLYLYISYFIFQRAIDECHIFGQWQLEWRSRHRFVSSPSQFAFSLGIRMR